MGVVEPGEKIYNNKTGYQSESVIIKIELTGKLEKKTCLVAEMFRFPINLFIWN